MSKLEDIEKSCQKYNSTKLGLKSLPPKLEWMFLGFRNVAEPPGSPTPLRTPNPIRNYLQPKSCLCEIFRKT